MQYSREYSRVMQGYQTVYHASIPTRSILSQQFPGRQGMSGMDLSAVRASKGAGQQAVEWRAGLTWSNILNLPQPSVSTMVLVGMRLARLP